MRKLCTPGENIFSGITEGVGKYLLYPSFYIELHLFYKYRKHNKKYITYSKNNDKLKKHI